MADTINPPDILVVGSRGRFDLLTVAPAPSAPSTFADVMTVDSWLFVQEFGEIITYKPKAGLEREIIAIIDRNPPEAIDEAPGNLAPNIVIEVRNDDVLGIASSEFSKTLDQVKIAVRFGETPVYRPIIKLIAHDVGMCRYGVG